MLNVLIALWLFFGFDQGGEHRLVPYDIEISKQTKCSVSEEIDHATSKPREVRTTWGKIKAIYRRA